MSLISRVKNNFEASINTKNLAKDMLASDIASASTLLVKCFSTKNKVLVCGNGGSAADSQHFSAELVNRFRLERTPLPCITLSADTSVITAIANDYGYDAIFMKQVIALGMPGDCLLAISTSGNSKNILNAVDAAHSNGMHVIALTGGDGGLLSKLIKCEGDIEIRVTSNVVFNIQETHILILHCLCDLIEYQMWENTICEKL